MTMTTTAARAGHTNEDFTGAVPTAAVLVDGAGVPGTESMCRHGVAWYAGRLGTSLLSRLSLAPDHGLSTLLAEAVERVTDEHRDTCDVADPLSPSAAVAVLRLCDSVVEYLVLGDAVLVLERADGAPLVVSDPREVVISEPYRCALEAVAPTARNTTDFSETCAPTGTSRAASGWPGTIRERRTRRSPEAVRSSG
ncbi:PP2C family serine/threonine-protein phosphatase [Streptomyces halstedii]|uniref:hypothetical protein n=1 Tax=Streptomyces halstedii TaxID=1944 RepID=UPI003805FD4A